MDPEKKSNILPRQSFAATGELVTYFEFENREDAETFLRGLNREPNVIPIQLNFRYTFSGVSVERCTAEVTGKQIRDVSERLKLEGDGSENYVGRNQLSEYVYNIFGEITINTVCRDDADAIEKLAKHALDKLGELGDPKTIMDGVWASFNSDTALNANDFAADLTTNLIEYDGVVDRDQWSKTTRNLREMADAIKGAGVIGKLGLAVAKSYAEATDDAKMIFEDKLEKRTDEIQFTGKTYVPKDIDKRINDVLMAKWSDGVSVSYDKIIDQRGVEYTIPLTSLNQTTLEPLQDEKILYQLNERFRDLQKQLNISNQAMEQKIKLARASADEKIKQARASADRKINSINQEVARVDNAKPDYKHLEKYLKQFARGIKTVKYRIHLDKAKVEAKTMHPVGQGAFLVDQFAINTGEPSSQYPSALVSHWYLTSCDRDFHTSPWKHNYSGSVKMLGENIYENLDPSWIIFGQFRRMGGIPISLLNCEYLYVAVTYYDSNLFIDIY